MNILESNPAASAAPATLAPDVQVYSLVGKGSSHLVVHSGHGLLVDCHSPRLPDWLQRRGLPAPDWIIHTGVSRELCREGNRFPHARIWVHRELRELAGDPKAYAKAAATTWDQPEKWPETMGRETYGVAGSVTVFPPDAPLKISDVFGEGDALEWQGLTFRVIALPGPGRHHSGFVLEKGGEPLAVFTGSLLCNPSKLVNVHDLESTYGGTTLPSLPGVLRTLSKVQTARYFPSAGRPILDGPEQACVLASAVDDYHSALSWKSGGFQPAPQPEYPGCGRYLKLHSGVYQNVGYGNCILLIDDQGYGLMVDPGPCEYESASRGDDFHGDLEYFERECGLRSIDLVLITHPHGDHYDMVPELLTRYPDCRIGAWDLVARVIEAPWDYPYAALLPWYNLGFDHVSVDLVLDESTPFDWHGKPIRTMHLPGHCYCHAAYLLEFNGLRLAITGDTVQSRGESSPLGFIIANHSVPDEKSGILKSYRQLATEDVDLNLGGHGSHFTNCEALYTESLRRIEYALPFLRKLVPNEDLDTAFLRPSFPRWPRS